jgi:uncharacterized protein YggE
MRKTKFLATMLLLTIVSTTGVAQNIIQPYVDISSNATREVTPDEIYLRITIKESDYKGKKSLEEMLDAMIGALKTNRIDIPECLSLNYMGSDVSYKLFSKSIKPKTEATYTLKLYDATIMQQVIASLEKRQISDIQLSQVKFTKEQELKNEMAIEAMQQAQSEARVLAGAIGQEIGKAISINSWMNSGQTQPRLYKARANMVLEDAVANEETVSSPVISIGKITYSFNVNVRFELK